jgi:hypothetical protein
MVQARSIKPSRSVRSRTLNVLASPPPPPKSDPARPLHLAIRSTRLLGAASVLCGLVVILAFGYFNHYALYRNHFIAGGMIVWFVPGVLLATCSHFLSHRRKGAVVAAMVVAFAQGVFAATLLYLSVTLTPVSPIPVILAALWVAAIVQLLHHLWRSVGAIRVDAKWRKGFEPLPIPLARVAEPAHDPTLQ